MRGLTLLSTCGRRGDRHRLCYDSEIDMSTALGGVSFLDDLKQYVGFTDDSTATLRELYPLAAPHFPRIVDDFLATIEAHPRARMAIGDGPDQTARLRTTLGEWLSTTLLGPHDDAYLASRARIGRVHVRIDLPQAYMFMAMNRIRMQLVGIAQQNLSAHLERLFSVTTALHQILDIELAIMLETYRDYLVIKNRNAEKLATIGQVATSIGHELRNPLAVIESSAYLVAKHLGPEGSRRSSIAKHLERISRETKQATRTISDLLALAHDRPLSRSRAPIRDLVRAAIEAALLPSGVTVETSLPERLCADLDPGQIQHVLTNLLVNASQAMGGTALVAIDAVLVDDGVRVRVRDEGPGVPLEIRRGSSSLHHQGQWKWPGVGALSTDPGGPWRHH